LVTLFKKNNKKNNSFMHAFERTCNLLELEGQLSVWVCEELLGCGCEGLLA